MANVLNAKACICKEKSHKKANQTWKKVKTIAKNDEIIATPPGETIKEQLKQQHMSRKELAKKMCISDKELALLLEGKALLTTEIANKLEKTLGISAKFWNRLEEIYLEKLVLIKERKNKK